MNEASHQKTELHPARRPVLRSSSFVPQGPVVHSRSNLGQLGFGFQKQSAQEVVLSSAWLWNQPSFDLRMSVSFPDEWLELQKHRPQGVLDFKNKFDFWVLRNLSESETLQLENLLEQSPGNRVVVAFHHHFDSDLFFANLNWRKWKLRHQMFLSFLPPSHEMDPLFSPQEVLSFLNRTEMDLPVLSYQFQNSKASEFYQTLNPSDYADSLKAQRPFLTRFLTAMDRRGFHFLVLALESFLAFISQGELRRFADFFRLLFKQVRLVKPTRLIKPIPIPYPLKKIYWFSRYQYQKRIRKNHEA